MPGGSLTLKLEVADLDPIINAGVEGVAQLIEKNGDQLSFKSATAGASVKVDSQRLIQVVTNLLTNSARYTPYGGKIEIATSVEPDGLVKLEVSDNGRGVPADRQAQIFDLFEQGAVEPGEGLGIGLTLVRAIVKLHGDTVALRRGRTPGLFPVIRASPRKSAISFHREIGIQVAPSLISGVFSRACHHQHTR